MSGRRGHTNDLRAGLSDQQRIHAQAQRQKLLHDLEIQVQITAPATRVGATQLHQIAGLVDCRWS